jgi:hypothetical protein
MATRALSCFRNTPRTVATCTRRGAPVITSSRTSVTLMGKGDKFGEFSKTLTSDPGHASRFRRHLGTNNHVGCPLLRCSADSSNSPRVCVARQAHRCWPQRRSTGTAATTKWSTTTIRELVSTASRTVRRRNRCEGCGRPSRTVL